MDHPPRRTRIRPLAWATWALLLNCVVLWVHIRIESYPLGQATISLGQPPVYAPTTDEEIINWAVEGLFGAVLMFGIWAMVARLSRSIWIDGICFIAAGLALAATAHYWQCGFPPFKGSLWSDPFGINDFSRGLFAVNLVAWAVVVAVAWRRRLIVDSFNRRQRHRRRP